MIMLWTILALVSTASTQELQGLEKMNTPGKSNGSVEIFSGLRLALFNQELQVKLDLKKMFPGQMRKHHDDDEKKPGGLMQNFGTMVVMLPLIIQMLSLPGAIASIKMSLLKSLLVAKLALLVILFNTLRNQQQPSEVVMIHQTPSQHHDHFYSPLHGEHEDDDKGWLG